VNIPFGVLIGFGLIFVGVVWLLTVFIAFARQGSR
jgi:hypothetical protein